MKIYASLTSPFARKARIVIAERGLDCPLVATTPREPGGPVQRMSPLGKVPLLETDSGEAIYDSPVIVEYLDGQPNARGEALLPPPGPARWAALRWQALGDGCAEATVARMLELRRPAEQQSADVIAWEERRIARALEAMEAGIDAARGGFLVDGSFTIADVAVGVALGYVDFRYAHAWRERHARLGRWYEAIAARPSFVATVPVG